MSNPTGEAIKAAEGIRLCGARDGKFHCQRPYNHDYHFGHTEATGHQWRSASSRDAKLLALASYWKGVSGQWDKLAKEYDSGEIGHEVCSTFHQCLAECAREIEAILKEGA